MSRLLRLLDKYIIEGVLGGYWLNMSPPVVEILSKKIIKYLRRRGKINAHIIYNII